MKRLSTLIVLLGLVMGVMVTGCNESKTTPETKAADTNPPPAAPTPPAAPSTNK